MKIEMSTAYSSTSDLTSLFLSAAQPFTTSIVKPVRSEIQSSESFFKQSSILRIKIQRTEELINELKELQKRTGLFNSEDTKINNLMLEIGESISSTQIGMGDLQKKSHDKSIKQSSAGLQAYKAIIEIIQSELIKITDSFKTSTERRIQEVTINSTKNFGITTQIEKRLPRNQGAKFLKQSSSHQQKPYLDDDKDIESNRNLISNEQTQKARFEFNDTEHHRVSQTMKSLNTQLQNVLETFKKIGSIVQMHETIVQRIDYNTDQAVMNLEKGKKEVIKVHRSTTSSKALMLKVTGHYYLIDCFANQFV